ncbi:MAG TPA: hypothetical protein VK610_04570 [Rhodothermales bacterium]|nr:hypothetical protein [Rhodothermales bacterium]
MPLASVPAPPARPTPYARERVLPFDPKRDGFHFTNRFHWRDEDLFDLLSQVGALAAGAVAAVPMLAGGLVGGRRGMLGGAVVGALAAPFAGAVVRGTARRWPAFGLCGGMALSAVERWPHRAGLPTSALEADRMRPLLRRRQAVTLRASGARFLVYWAAIRAGRGDRLSAPFGRALDREIEKACAQIDHGRPAIIGLIGDAPDPFEMHQVVAFGYHEEPDGRVRFSVYDPNAPGTTRHVTAGVRGGRTDVTTDLPTGKWTDGSYRLSTVAGRLGMVIVVA